jgi:hypothetical protein
VSYNFENLINITQRNSLQQMKGQSLAKSTLGRLRMLLRLLKTLTTLLVILYRPKQSEMSSRNTIWKPWWRRKSHYYLSDIRNNAWILLEVQGMDYEGMDYEGLEEGYLVRWDKNQQIWVKWQEVDVETKGLVHNKNCDWGWCFYSCW